MKDLLLLSTAAIAYLEIGVNIALLVRFWNESQRWFKTKICAVEVLLLYIALSCTRGNPEIWRGVLGLLAVALDGLALLWMWIGLRQNSLKNPI